MLDPHIRQPLAPAGNGTFALRFTVPDVYGVFKYVIDYHHAGYSYINLQQVGGWGGGEGRGGKPHWGPLYSA